jgi:hypothetical protein
MAYNCIGLKKPDVMRTERLTIDPTAKQAPAVSPLETSKAIYLPPSQDASGQNFPHIFQ